MKVFNGKHCYNDHTDSACVCVVCGCVHACVHA